MKDHFNRFAVRFLTALLLGLLLILMHSWGRNAIFHIFAPQYAAPWELCKLAYWPMLLTMLVTGGLSGGVRKTITKAAPCLVVTTLALFLALWAVSLLRPAGGIYLLLLVVGMAVGLALADREIGRGNMIWLALAAVLAILFILFTFLPPVFGPFLDPADAVALAVPPC